MKPFKILNKEGKNNLYFFFVESFLTDKELKNNNLNSLEKLNIAKDRANIFDANFASFSTYDSKFIHGFEIQTNNIKKTIKKIRKCINTNIKYKLIKVIENNEEVSYHKKLVKTYILLDKKCEYYIYELFSCFYIYDKKSPDFPPLVENHFNNLQQAEEALIKYIKNDVI